MGAIYKCDSSQKCSYYVSDSNDEFKCDDTIKRKPDGKGDWQTSSSSNATVAGACLGEDIEAEDGTENAAERLFSVGDDLLPPFRLWVCWVLQPRVEYRKG